MHAQKYLDLLREIRDVAFATVSKDKKPQVRIIDVMITENEKLYFCTARGKDFYEQLTASGQTAVTGMTKSYQMIRLEGTAERLKNQKEWIDRIFDENYIKETCIECGKCAAGCPQQCITPANPYRIVQEHCLHCGLCFENCPVSAVGRSTE